MGSRDHHQGCHVFPSKLRGGYRQAATAAIAIMSIFLVPPVWSYEAITVTDGGTISGKVTITGGDYWMSSRSRRTAR